MIEIRVATEVSASPDEAWRFFREIERHYGDWYPENLRWRWLSGEPLEAGAVWFAEEFFDGMRSASRFFVTESATGRFFAYRAAMPGALIGVAGSFAFEPTSTGGTEITEVIRFGFKTPVIGPALDAVIRLLLPIDAMRRHLREEGEGLSRLLGEPVETAAG